MHHILFKETMVWGSIFGAIAVPALSIAKARATHWLVEKLRDFRPGIEFVED